MANNEQTDAGEKCAVVRGFDKNSVADTTVNLQNGAKYYFVTRVIEDNPSSTFAGSSATLALYTAAAAGGTAVVSAATATGLTAAGKYKSHTVAAHDLQTGPLYLRNTVAEGSALTSDVHIYYLVLG